MRSFVLSALGVAALVGGSGLSSSASAFTIDFGVSAGEPITVVSVPANDLFAATSVSVPFWTPDTATVTLLTLSNPITLTSGDHVTISFDFGGNSYTDTTTISTITRVGTEVALQAAGDLVGDSLKPNVSALDITFNQAGGTGHDITGSGTYTTTAGIVPEPATWAMMVIGFAGLTIVGMSRRRKGARFAF
jgi:hypothetical protein